MHRIFDANYYTSIINELWYEMIGFIICIIRGPPTSFPYTGKRKMYAGVMFVRNTVRDLIHRLALSCFIGCSLSSCEGLSYKFDTPTRTILFGWIPLDRLYSYRF